MPYRDKAASTYKDTHINPWRRHQGRRRNILEGQRRRQQCLLARQRRRRRNAQSTRQHTCQHIPSSSCTLANNCTRSRMQGTEGGARLLQHPSRRQARSVAEDRDPSLRSSLPACFCASYYHIEGGVYIYTVCAYPPALHKARAATQLHARLPLHNAPDC